MAEPANSPIATPPPPPTQAPIAELQQAFSTLLLLTRTKPAHPLPKTKPKWTGSFRLFDFPRELRDRIYHYVLHEPNGVVYRRNRAQVFPFEDPQPVQLFLCSRQVYDEALQVFCRVNVVRISYRAQLAGTLRLFPDRAGRMVRRVRLVYHSYGAARTMAERWGEIVAEARLVKEYFPVLRECTATWDVFGYMFSRENLNLSEKTVEEQTVVWAAWMRHCYSADKLVPPRWLRVEFGREWMGQYAVYQVSFAEALDVLRGEIKSDGDPEELEGSGRRWLEERFPHMGRSRKSARKVKQHAMRAM